MTERRPTQTNQQEFCHLCQDLELCQFASILARAASEGASVRIRFHQPEFRVCTDYEQLKTEYLNPAQPEISQHFNYYESLLGQQEQPLDTSPPVTPPPKRIEAVDALRAEDQPQLPLTTTEDRALESTEEVAASEPEPPLEDVPPATNESPSNDNPTPSAPKKREAWSINPAGKKPKKPVAKKPAANKIDRAKATDSEIEIYLNRCKTPPELHQQFREWNDRLGRHTYLHVLHEIRDEIQALEYSVQGTPQASEVKPLVGLFIVLLQYVSETKGIPFRAMLSNVLAL